MNQHDNPQAPSADCPPALLASNAALPGFLQRAEGEAEVVFRLHGRASVLARLYQRAPCRMLFPMSASGDCPVAVLITTSGGLAGGDRLRLTVSVEPGAALVVVSQAAEKIYRSLGPDSRCLCALNVADGGWLEWLPQETILFEGARLDRWLDADVSSGGRFLACEMLVFGRRARGERLTKGFLHEAWRIRSRGRLIWADQLHLEDGGWQRLSEPLAFADAAAMATAVYVAHDAANHLGYAREITAAAGCHAGATIVNGILLARFLGEDAATVRGDLYRYTAGLRHKAAGLPGALPRLWQV